MTSIRRWFGNVNVNRRRFSCDVLVGRLLGTSETNIDSELVAPPGDVQVTVTSLSGAASSAEPTMPALTGSARETLTRKDQLPSPVIAVPSRCVGGEAT